MLDVKFRSANYNANRIAQKQNEVSQNGKQSQQDRSCEMWRRLNPGYMPEEPCTMNKVMQEYDLTDYKQSKENFRVRDRHTEYVEYLVRDQALARKKKNS